MTLPRVAGSEAAALSIASVSAVRCCLIAIALTTWSLAAGQTKTNEKPRSEGVEAPESVLFESMPTVDAASLHTQSLQEAPGNVSVISREDIHRFGYRTLGEAISWETGFYMSYDRAYHYVGVRGYSLPGDYNTRFLVMLNGHYLTDNIYDSNGFFGQDFGVDLDLVERIEVIRGPSSVLYGSNGMFATINVVTRAPSDLAPRVSAEFGSFGEKKVSASGAWDLGRGARALVEGSVFRNGGQSLEVAADGSPATRTAARVDGETGYHFFTNIAWREWTFTAFSGMRQKMVPTGWYNTILNDTGNRISDARSFLEAAYVRNIGADGSLRWRIYYDQYRYDGRYDYLRDEGAVEDSRDKSRGDWMGSQLSYRFQPWRVGAVTVGAEAQGEFRTLQENFVIAPEASTLLHTDIRDRGVGVFAQQEWNLTPRLQANLGVRFDDSRRSQGVVSPRASLVFQKSAQTTFKFLYGRAFRNPSAYEKYYGDGIFNYANSELVPERVNTWEGAVERRLGSAYSLSAAAYHSRLSDLITAVNLSPGAQQFQNVLSNRATGVDLEFKAHLPSETELLASVSWQDVTNSAQSYQVNSPAAIGKLRFYTPLARRRVGFAAAFSYLSSRRTVPGDNLDPVYVTDLTLSSNRSYQGMEFSAGIRNLFNQRYSDPVGLEHGTDRLRQNGVSFYVKVTWQREQQLRPSGHAAGVAASGGGTGRR